MSAAPAVVDAGSVEPPASPRWSWSRSAHEAQRDLALALAVVIALTLVRLLFIACFSRELAPASGAGELAVTMLAGLRFDARIAFFIALPTLVLSLLQLRVPLGGWTRRLRAWIGALFLSATVLLAMVDIGFYAEYREQFDNQVLGVIYDDLGAVLATVWAEHHVVLAALGWAALSGAMAWGLGRTLGATMFGSPRLAALPAWAKVAVSLSLIALAVVAARGSVWRRPVQRKDIAVTGDAFLDKMVLNPWKALQYAIEDHLALAHSAGIEAYLPDGDVRAAARRWFGVGSEGADLDACSARIARGATAPPRTVWVMVMESYSAWPLLPEYRSLGLAGEVESLMRDGTGTLRFLSAGPGTMSSLGTILTGLQECGVQTNYQPSARRPYPTALAPAFARLGYRTRFFYGGFPSWQRIGPFARDQGFDEVYGGGDMGASFLEGKEWGIDDDRLLEFAATTAAAHDGPSLNVVLTVSNHPPYGLDIERLGFPLRAPPADLASRWDGSSSLRVLGHFWWADRCLGDFVRRVVAADRDALVVVTGDHYGRRFVDARPSVHERTAVPFVLHGPRVLAGRTLDAAVAGGHVDIPPTLIELAAPAGFAYHAFGRDLLGPQPPRAGYGRSAAITATGTVEWEAGVQVQGEAGDVEALHRAYLDLCALSWWRIRRGAAWDGAPRQ